MLAVISLVLRRTDKHIPTETLCDLLRMILTMNNFTFNQQHYNLKIFIDYLNNIHPTIKLTSSHSITNGPFLDVMVSLHNGTIEIDLYTKPTDKHQNLLS